MKDEKPILMNQFSVKGILEGRKSCTRRVIKTKHTLIDRMTPEEWKAPTPNRPAIGGYPKEEDGWYMFKTEEGCGGVAIKCPWKVGMKLWCKETYTDYINGRDTEYPLFKADMPMHWDVKDTECDMDIDLKAEDYKWKPSLFMRKEYARIWLEITNIKVEKLQDISSNDAWEEGCICNCMHPTRSCKGNIDSFQSLWNSINGDKKGYSFQDNPWIWCIYFKRIK